jgi:hypothetical protein
MAQQLGAVIIKLDIPVSVLDINKRLSDYYEVCYVQLEFPAVPNFRAIVLCLVQENSHIPFLLGNNDQAAYSIIPQADTRTVRVGAQKEPIGTVSYLPADKWQSIVKNPARPLTKKQLEDLNQDLAKQIKLANIYRNIDPIIRILSNSGVVQSTSKTDERKPEKPAPKVNEERRAKRAQRAQERAQELGAKGGKVKGNATVIAREELKQALREAPIPNGQRVQEVETISHQSQLLANPEIARTIDIGRKMDQWRAMPSVQALSSAKMDPESSDAAISNLKRASMRDAVTVFLGQVIQSSNRPTPISGLEIMSIQEYVDNWRLLVDNELGNTVDPGIAPESAHSEDVFASMENWRDALGGNSGILKSPGKTTLEEKSVTLLEEKLVTALEEKSTTFIANDGTTEGTNERTEQPKAVPCCSAGHMYCLGPTLCYSCLLPESFGIPDLEDLDEDDPPTPVTKDTRMNVLSAYLNAVASKPGSGREEPLREMYTDEELGEHEEMEMEDKYYLPVDEVLPPNAYDREWIHIFHGKVPIKPAPAHEETEKLVDEKEFLSPNWVPLDNIADLNDTLYSSEVLRALQKAEEKLVMEDPSRGEELKVEIEKLKKTYCKITGEHLKPDEFPSELWQYVFDDQKGQVAERFALFPPDVRKELIKEICEKLDIGDKFGEAPRFFMRAQALANLDVFGYPDPYSPPTVPGYTFRIQTVHDLPIYQSPQRFNQLETAFLDARIYELVNVAKVEPAPNSQHNCGLVLVPYTERIKQTISEWEEQGLNPLEEMFRPSNYKKVVLWYRLTNNLKALNDVTLPYRYPMPDAEDPKHFCHGSRYWSATDIKDAFFCVNLHPDDRDKTAFTTPRGRFRFCVMPQGAMNSPTFFSNVAQETFSHIPKSELLNFIDDTTNHSRTFTQHLKTQQAMYEALRKKRLIMKVSKSHFLQDSVRCLGHIFSEFGYTPDPTHIKAIMDMATPTDQTGVKSFLGLLNFNRQYIPRFADLVGPLNDLLRKDVDVKTEWRDDFHGEHFRRAKVALTSAPCLQTIDSSKPFTLHVDSCKNGRGPGAVLLQQNKEGEWRPVSYFSCRLRKGEHAWSATELEAMGLVYAIRHWSSYLKIQKFTAIVDHHALIWLVTRPAKTANGRILHWISDLQEYHFDLIHRSGQQHLDADAISRLLHFADIPRRVEDASDLVAPANGPMTQEILQEAVRNAKAQEEYWKYLTSKTFLDINGPPSQLPERMPQNRLPGVSTLKSKSKASTKGNGAGEINLESYMEIGQELPSFTLPDLAVEEEDDNNLDGESDNNGENKNMGEQENEGTVGEQEDEGIILPDEIAQVLSGIIPSPIELLFPSLVLGQKRVMDRQFSIHVLSGQRGQDGQRAPSSDYLPPSGQEEHNIVLRDVYLAPIPRGPGRRKKEDQTPPPKIGRAWIEQRMNIDTDHPRAKAFQHHEHDIFIDPTNRRIYKVCLVAYDRYKKVVAYRRCLDDDPPDPNDDKPWKMEGEGGILEQIEKYRATHDALQHPWRDEPIK